MKWVGIEKTLYLRGKKLSEAGHDITFVYSRPEAQLNTLEKWSKVGNVRYIDAVQNEWFDLVIYDAIYNLKKVNAKRNNYIQVINGNLADSKEVVENLIPFKKYVSVSEEARKQFKQVYHKDSVVIPNLIDQEEVLRLSKEKVDIEKKSHNFVIASRIDKYKGFEKLEIALKKCEERYGKDYQVVVVGSCNLFDGYVKEIQNRLKGYNVIWEGMQENPYKYMRWADSLWQFSVSESQCMVMYEALICGTPCVCTNFANAVKELTSERGIVVSQDLSDFDLEKVEKLKKGFKYEYPDYSKEWLKLLEPPEKKDYKFSIIIPNYNNGQYLEGCINSILEQTYKNYEIIFIDDMSEDNSLDIAKKLLKAPHKVLKVPYKKYNGGTRNIGIIEATGDYIMCIDSDDKLLYNTVLEELNEFIDGEDLIRLGYSLYDGKISFTDIPKHNSMYDVFIEPTCAVWTKVIKREILQDTLFVEGTLMEDKVHHYRIVNKCTNFVDFPKATHIWNRTNTHSVSTKRNYKWDSSMYRHIADMMDFINETDNERYKSFVKEKIKTAKQMAERGDYKQI